MVPKKRAGQDLAAAPDRADYAGVVHPVAAKPRSALPCPALPCRKRLSSQLSMHLLNRQHIKVVHRMHALYRRLGTSDGGEGSHPRLQRRGPNMA